MSQRRAPLSQTESAKDSGHYPQERRAVERFEQGVVNMATDDECLRYAHEYARLVRRDFQVKQREP